MLGILVGFGKNPQEAIDQVAEWEKNGTSQLLAKSKMNRGYLVMGKKAPEVCPVFKYSQSYFEVRKENY